MVGRGVDYEERIRIKLCERLYFFILIEVIKGFLGFGYVEIIIL